MNLCYKQNKKDRVFITVPIIIMILGDMGNKECEPCCNRRKMEHREVREVLLPFATQYNL
jgi:hypothetical protein